MRGCDTPTRRSCCCRRDTPDPPPTALGPAPHVSLSGYHIRDMQHPPPKKNSLGPAFTAPPPPPPHTHTIIYWCCLHGSIPCGLYMSGLRWAGGGTDVRHAAAACPSLRVLIPRPAPSATPSCLGPQQKGMWRCPPMGQRGPVHRDLYLQATVEASHPPFSGVYKPRAPECLQPPRPLQRIPNFQPRPLTHPTAVCPRPAAEQGFAAEGPKRHPFWSGL